MLGVLSRARYQYTGKYRSRSGSTVVRDSVAWRVPHGVQDSSERWFEKHSPAGQQSGRNRAWLCWLVGFVLTWGCQTLFGSHLGFGLTAMYMVSGRLKPRFSNYYELFTEAPRHCCLSFTNPSLPQSHWAPRWRRVRSVTRHSPLSCLLFRSAFVPSG